MGGLIGMWVSGWIDWDSGWLGGLIGMWLGGWIYKYSHRLKLVMSK